MKIQMSEQEAEREHAEQVESGELPVGVLLTLNELRAIAAIVRDAPQDEYEGELLDSISAKAQRALAELNGEVGS